MGVTLAISNKAHRDDSLGYERKERLFIIGVIIIFVVFIAVNIIYNWQSIIQSIFSSRFAVSRYEIIRIKSTSVTKSSHVYFVIINFANYGAINAKIDSVLLNGIPYDDQNWTGAIKPLVFGDITPNTWINTSVPYDPNSPLLSWMVIFSDCRDPNGNKLIASWHQYYVNVTIRTYMGRDYNTSVMLPQGPILQNAPSPLMAIIIVIASTALFIFFVRRRARRNPIERADMVKDGR